MEQTAPDLFLEELMVNVWDRPLERRWVQQRRHAATRLSGAQDTAFAWRSAPPPQLYLPVARTRPSISGQCTLPSKHNSREQADGL
eukprot:SAG31_NODE_1113_length_9854_cov_2.770682_5_plen_86_part_00